MMGLNIQCHVISHGYIAWNLGIMFFSPWDLLKWTIKGYSNGIDIIDQHNEWNIIINHNYISLYIHKSGTIFDKQTLMILIYIYFLVG